MSVAPGEAYAKAAAELKAAERDLSSVQRRVADARRATDGEADKLRKGVGQNTRRKVLATGTPGEVVVVEWHEPLTSGNPIISVDVEKVNHE